MVLMLHINVIEVNIWIFKTLCMLFVMQNTQEHPTTSFFNIACIHLKHFLHMFKAIRNNISCSTIYILQLIRGIAHKQIVLLPPARWFFYQVARFVSVKLPAGLLPAGRNFAGIAHWPTSISFFLSTARW